MTKSDDKKKAFLRLYFSKAGNITTTCEAIGLHRNTYYRWLQRDPRFKKRVEVENEKLLDTAESLLMTSMLAGNMTAIIFFLKCKGKNRGWIDRAEVMVGGMEEHPVRVADDDIKRVLVSEDGQAALEKLTELLLGEAEKKENPEARA